jgi:hypothetical protein
LSQIKIWILHQSISGILNLQRSHVVCHAEVQLIMPNQKQVNAALIWAAEEARMHSEWQKLLVKAALFMALTFPMA